MDVGTGPGFFAIILAELGYDLVGVDANEGMLDQARHNAESHRVNVEYELMDAQALSFAKETFDIVVSRNLTWVLPNPKLAYQEWCRVLKPGGLLINFDANWYNYLYDENLRLEYAKDRLNVAEKGMEDHFLCTDINAMEQIALQVPLSSVKRPGWDIEILTALHMRNIKIAIYVGDRLLSEIEKVNYASTPYFKITATK